MSQTRAKVDQAGIPAVRRLAETARDAARARSAESTFIDGGLAAGTPHLSPIAQSHGQLDDSSEPER